MPVVNALAPDYPDVTFLGVGGRSDYESTADAAAGYFTADNFLWGFDEREGIWAAYGARGQPVTVLINADDEIVDFWFGLRDESEIREAVARLTAAA